MTREVASSAEQQVQDTNRAFNAMEMMGVSLTRVVGLTGMRHLLRGWPAKAARLVGRRLRQQLVRSTS